MYSLVERHDRFRKSHVWKMTCGGLRVKQEILQTEQQTRDSLSSAEIQRVFIFSGGTIRVPTQGYVNSFDIAPALTSHDGFLQRTFRTFAEKRASYTKSNWKKKPSGICRDERTKFRRKHTLTCLFLSDWGVSIPSWFSSLLPNPSSRPVVVNMKVKSDPQLTDTTLHWDGTSTWNRANPCIFSILYKLQRYEIQNKLSSRVAAIFKSWSKYAGPRMSSKRRVFRSSWYFTKTRIRKLLCNMYLADSFTTQNDFPLVRCNSHLLRGRTIVLISQAQTTYKGKILFKLHLIKQEISFTT